MWCSSPADPSLLSLGCLGLVEVWAGVPGWTAQPVLSCPLQSCRTWQGSPSLAACTRGQVLEHVQQVRSVHCLPVSDLEITSVTKGAAFSHAKLWSRTWEALQPPQPFSSVSNISTCLLVLHVVLGSTG